MLALAAALAACDATSSSPPPEATTERAPERPSATAELDALAARVLDEELGRALTDARVRSALAVVLDPRDGRVIAMQSLDRDGARDPERPAREARNHGSLVKSLTIAAALDAGVITTTDSFDGRGGALDLGGVTVRDAEPHGAMTPADVLALSSNVGAIQIYQRLGRDGLASSFARFGLAHRVPDAARSDDVLAARLAYGAALEATPLEHAAALAAIANGGVHHAPWRTGEPPSPGARAITADTAASVLAMLEGAVSRDDGTGRRARVPGLRVAGKTGTVPVGEDARYGAFVGAAPLPEPRLVVLAGAVAEGSDYGGGTIAAPTFARIVARLLAPGDAEGAE